jgi:hypothetical protein
LYSLLIYGMGNIGKEISLLLVVILAVSSLMMVESAFAQSIPKPSVPEFTVKYADYSYDIPASTSIDPFTGKTVTNPAQHIENKTIQLTIKNQTINGPNSLYYKIRMKGHFSQEWSNISSIQANPNSEYTVLLYSTSREGTLDFSRLNFNASSGGVLDIQVQAQIWTWVQSEGLFGSWNQRITAESDWSGTQTITIPEGSDSTSASPNPTPTPTVPEFPTWTILLLLNVMVALAGLSVYHKKHMHRKVGGYV